MRSVRATDESVLAFDMLRTAEAAFSADMNGRIVAWNKAAEQLLGFRTEDVLGLRCCDVIGAGARLGHHSPLECCKAIGNAKRGRPTRPFELATANRAGEIKWLDVTTLLARSAVGHKRVVRLLRDVTAHHRLGARMARATTLPAADEMSAPHTRRTPSAALAAPPRHHQITPREMEVLRLLAYGLTTHEIAAAFGISPITARNHVSKVMEKLGATTRLQAVVLASHIGLL
jgi:PAS domain S-box-containing protein